MKQDQSTLLSLALSATAAGAVTAKATPAPDDSSKRLATTEYVKVAGRLNRILVYRMNAGVQQVSINGSAFTPTGAGLYTPATGMMFIKAQVQGGGGAAGGTGAAAAGNVSVGAPGASGACGVSLFSSVDIGASKAVTVGAGGVAAPNAAGTGGGASSIGTLLSAPGGAGGTLLNNVAPPAVIGNSAGSAAPTGANLLALVGAAGSATFASSSLANGMLGGCGGSSPLGAGPAGAAGNAAAISASNYGTGGSGVAVNQTGGALAGGHGAAGVVVIEEYI
ncbi:hypothetical protein HF313_09800 [Massilia atriviolacea]|uniref:Uncharacterized protein n=1 Tax=Massilia atriviolacea TaxID=2495579 RepID=A0A430HF60_9BURK|nr:hypothetical protein [Massilia atriviolacea]RSZ56155.1 hypothetical protein EJB06_26315 [Massilia atriviolacea]